MPDFLLKQLPAGPVTRASGGTLFEAMQAAGIQVALVQRADYSGPYATDPSPMLASLEDYLPVVHFVGFRPDTNPQQWVNAARVFGEPTFVHYVWDQRAQREIAPADTVVFAKYDPARPLPWNYDDSNEADDPAATERRQSA